MACREAKVRRRRLRLVLLGVRRRPGAAEGGDAAGQSDLALRGLEARRRALLPDVRPPLRLETVSLRYFNVFGPRQNPESKYSAVIPRFLELALQDEPLEVHGDGEQSRDFTYIDNVVQANLRAMETPGVSGEVFNIACGTRHSLLDHRGRDRDVPRPRS